MSAMAGADYRLKYILAGSSGSGKTTMASVLERELGLRRCITSTTRPPRPGEQDGVAYHFRPQLDPKELFEYAVFGGHEYGITRDELRRGDFIILDPQGVDYYRRHYPGPLTVIQLMRDGIDVDPERMARDRAAGFDRLCPDIIVRGETVEEMAANLLCAIKLKKPALEQQIRVASQHAEATPGSLVKASEQER